jgi:hypothetical protein
VPLFVVFVINAWALITKSIIIFYRPFEADGSLPPFFSGPAIPKTKTILSALGHYG